MLQNSTDSETYIRTFRDKFSNFAQKAPTLISFITTSDGVILSHENTGRRYQFDWDFSTPIKKFIHDIKTVLREFHYPRIEHEEVKFVPLSEERATHLLLEGKGDCIVGNLEKIVTLKKYIIDKVITLKDIFIIIDEDTQIMYRYKMKSSSIFYLKRYRSGQFKTLLEAGEDFFNKCEFLGELKAVEE